MKIIHYLVDMYDFSRQTPEVWAVFMRGDFSYQKSDIPETTIGPDHTGKQKRK